MRALFASLLSAVLLLSAAATHVHVRADAQDGPHGADKCAVCVLRSADVSQDATPDVTPHAVVLGAAPLAPGLPPVSGAPLGAIPGQSPPRA